MADAKCHKDAPELLLLAALKFTEHVVNTIRTPLLRVRRDAPHAIEAVEITCGEREEVGETAHAAAVNKLLEQLLTEPLNVQRATTDRVTKSLKYLRLTPRVRAAVPHLIAHNLTVA
jgi:hypothetical protein